MFNWYIETTCGFIGILTAASEEEMRKALPEDLEVVVLREAEKGDIIFCM